MEKNILDLDKGTEEEIYNQVSMIIENAKNKETGKDSGFGKVKTAHLCQRLKLKEVDNIFVEYNPLIGMFEATAVIYHDGFYNALCANKNRRSAIIEAVKTCRYKYENKIQGF